MARVLRVPDIFVHFIHFSPYFYNNLSIESHILSHSSLSHFLSI
jgi:hypothetical protein